MFASVRWGDGEKGISVDQIQGHVSFSQKSKDQSVRVYVNIRGLPEGEHGFHVHEKSLEDTDERCIVGRSIVIHEDPDDLGIPEYEDQKKNIGKLITGNAGKRIACGNIELEESEE